MIPKVKMLKYIVDSPLFKSSATLVVLVVEFSD